MLVVTRVLGALILALGVVSGALAQPLPAGPRHVPADPSSPEVVLGRLLFFDPRLSRDGTIACASCHGPDHAFADPRPVAIGIDGRRGTRNAPSVMNRGRGAAQFWDGRAATLEDQAKGPLINPSEMGNPDHAAVVARLQQIPGYAARFQAVFGTAALTIDQVAQAIAAFERTLVSGDAPYDRHASGDRTALDAAARRGLALFEGRAGCAQCHRGANFTDEKFHNIGVGTAAAAPDAGRFAITGRRADWAAFKTPSLRDVALTAPYMHDGSLATLDAVIEYYARGGLDNPNLARELHPLRLSQQDRRDLVAFLDSLTGTRPRVGAPRELPR